MNRLSHLEEFEQILRHYHVSPGSRTVLEGLKLVLLAAPTSSGRNTIINELLQTGEYHFVVSDTTRKPRVNNNVSEQDGVEYWFRSEEEVLEDLKQGRFLEAAIIHEQQVSGISIRELEKAKSTNKVAITDIEIAGIDSVLAVKPDTKAIFVLPPNFAQWHERLKQRGDMTKPELVRRMHSAASELRHAIEEDHYSLIINDDLKEAVEHVHQIVFGKQQDLSYQKSAHTILEQLLVDTERFLSEHS